MLASTARRAAPRIVMVALFACTLVTNSHAQVTNTLGLRGHDQTLRLYGARGGRPVVVSSGDGGWIHLGPHVAEVLSANGYFVVGFDAKAYLESFTSGRTTLRPTDEPGDYKALAAFASRGTTYRTILVGVSEGAGLSVLAAADPDTKAAIAGVLALGLPDVSELGWRWRDAIIYLTHGVPNEPLVETATVIAQVAPLPLAAIHSSHDEFVPLSTVQTLLRAAREPKRLWVVEAANHRFSNNLAEFDRRLLEAMTWIGERAATP